MQELCVSDSIGQGVLSSLQTVFLPSSFLAPLEPANKLTWPQNAPPSSGLGAYQHQSQSGQFCKPGTQAQGSQGPGQGLHAEKDKGALGFYSSGNPT